MTTSEQLNLEKVLLPTGNNFEDPNRLSALLEQYKLLVETSERLVARRQNVNTFFLSVNSLLLSAIGFAVGLMAKEDIQADFIFIGSGAVVFAGISMCVAWQRLVQSHAQLNEGKFAVIHLMEMHLPAAIFKAEWVALGEGRNPKKYRAFTTTEKWIPRIFLVLYIFSLLLGWTLWADLLPDWILRSGKAVS